MRITSTNPGKHKRGTAYVEALAVLPVMVLIFGGLFVMAGRYHAALDARSEARRLAWADSNNVGSGSCTGDAGECQFVAGGGEGGEFENCGDPDAKGVLTGSATSSHSGLDALIHCDTENGDDAGGFCLGEFPFVSDALGALIGEITDSTGTGTFRNHNIYGGDIVQISTQYGVMCNTRPQSLNSMVRSAAVGAIRKGFDIIGVSTPGPIDSFLEGIENGG